MRKFTLLVPLVQNEIRSLVAKNKLCAAAELLSQFAELYGEANQNNVSILQRGINEIENELLLGKIGIKEASELRNQLAYRLLNMADNFANDVYP